MESLLFSAACPSSFLEALTYYFPSLVGLYCFWIAESESSFGRIDSFKNTSLSFKAMKTLIFKKKKQEEKNIALDRIKELFAQADKTTNHALAKRYVTLARN